MKKYFTDFLTLGYLLHVLELESRFGFKQRDLLSFYILLFAYWNINGFQENQGQKIFFNGMLQWAGIFKKKHFCVFQFADSSCSEVSLNKKLMPRFEMVYFHLRKNCWSFIKYIPSVLPDLLPSFCNVKITITDFFFLHKKVGLRLMSVRKVPSHIGYQQVAGHHIIWLIDDWGVVMIKGNTGLECHRWNVTVVWNLIIYFILLKKRQGY